MPEGIAACVVLYNPASEVVGNIRSYYPYVDYLIAIDNSEDKNQDTEQQLRGHFEKLVYISQKDNPGIGAALNIACRTATIKGTKWLLTMDQDSSFVNSDLTVMISHISAVKNMFGPVGIITPYHMLTDSAATDLKEEFSRKKIAMTSGNLLNLEAYKVTGPFNESLFMDYVDYEYCLRLRSLNYTVVQDNKVRLNHALGNFEERKLLGKKIPVSHHSPLRKYYRARNSLFTAFKYMKTEPVFLSYVLLDNFIIIPFVTVFYEKQKWRKLKSLVRGTFDFIRGKYGKTF